MEEPILGHRDGRHFYVERLRPEDVGVAADLCDRCVGKNLYPRPYLAEICGEPDHFFYLLRSPDGQAAGYYYFHLTDLAGMARYTRLPLAQLTDLCRPNPRVAHLRSIGILEAYRREHMSVCLVRYFLRMLETELHADMAFCVCWKPQGKIPVTRSLEAFSFRHLADVARFWYDVPELECPICRGRCRCDAAVYYKLFEGGSKP